MSDDWGCAPVFVGVILAAGLLLFGSCTVLPGIDKWTESNEQIAAIESAKDAQIAQLQAERDLAVARAMAERDVLIAKERAAADVQMAAINLAGSAADSAAVTLRLVLVLVFCSFMFVVGAGAFTFTVLNWERL